LRSVAGEEPFGLIAVKQSEGLGAISILAPAVPVIRATYLNPSTYSLMAY
jgi:hypothetical protein